MVNNFVGDMEDGFNLADLINESLVEGEMARYQVKQIIHALLYDKLAYSFKTYNLLNTIEDPELIVETVSEWGNIDVVICYNHPQEGLQVINPKSKDSFLPSLPLVRDELVLVYARGLNEADETAISEKAVDAVVKLLMGIKLRTPAKFIGEGKAAAPAPAPAPQTPAAQSESEEPASGGKRRTTPKYSVIVTNELFHNGNVEAWKKIIASYKAAYPGLDVLIWYDNERINDINSLFKWGKVKHGTPIMISVVGEKIKGVSKLQRYLLEGASPRFEVFLEGSVDRVLDLF